MVFSVVSNAVSTHERGELLAAMAERGARKVSSQPARIKLKDLGAGLAVKPFMPGHGPGRGGKKDRHRADLLQRLGRADRELSPRLCGSMGLSRPFDRRSRLLKKAEREPEGRPKKTAKAVKSFWKREAGQGSKCAPCVFVKAPEPTPPRTHHARR